MKTQAHAVAQAVRQILLVSGMTLAGTAGPAMAATLTGLTGRTPSAIMATPAPPRAPLPQGSNTNLPPVLKAKSAQNFSAALSKIQQQLAAQAAARELAKGAPSDVPDGLTEGGLKVAQGKTWQGAQDPTQSQADGLITVEVEQTEKQAILSWDSFNVGKNTKLYFNQKGGVEEDGANTWIALNRVTDPSGVPSKILGQIEADATVLVVNRNGVIFGGSSQVNVRSLVASSLEITDDTFLRGIVTAPPATPTVPSPVFANADGTAADIKVEAGAIIKTRDPATITEGGGTVMLLGGNVENAGTVIANDGQVLFGAGTSAWVYSSPDPAIRGATVKVLKGGKVTNTAEAYVSAPTGNISIVGMNIEQRGVLVSSTSVDAAGSIVLSANEGLKMELGSVGPIPNIPLATHTGTVNLFDASLTAVLPEQSDRTAVDGQPQGQSLVRIDGETLHVRGGSSIFAPGGKVQMVATSDPKSIHLAYYFPTSSAGGATAADAGRLYVGEGASIDVAGLKNVLGSVTSDFALVEVRGNELRDSLAQQGGVLQNEKVYVNINDLLSIAPDQQYTPGGALEVSGWTTLTARTVDERLTKAGSVSLVSTGDLIVRPNAFIDISGGSTWREGAYVPRTFLIGADGHRYDINDAPEEMEYLSIGAGGEDRHARWNLKDSFSNGFLDAKTYQASYLHGEDAGDLTLVTRQLQFDANVDASTVRGVNQRAAGTLPKNGTLTIGGSLGNVGNNAIHRPNDVIVGPLKDSLPDVFSEIPVTGLFPADPGYNAGPRRARDPNTLLPADARQSTYLAAERLSEAQFGAITINGGRLATTSIMGGFSVLAGSTLTLAPGGTLTVNTIGGMLLEGNIVARGGNVLLNSVSGTNTANGDVVLKGTIDVSGLWINDALDESRTSPLLYDGGDVTLNATGNILLEAGSLIDASSGGYMNLRGKLQMAGGLPVGNGGDITIDPGHRRPLPLYSRTVTGGVVRFTNNPQTYPYQAVLDGDLRSHGFTRGGLLSIAAPQIVIGGESTSGNGVLALEPGFFTDNGFNDFRLYGYQGVTVAPGTVLDLQSTGFTPNALLSAVATDGDFRAVAALGPRSAMVPPKPISMLLSATDPFAGDLTFGEGAVIRSAPGATVALHAQRKFFFDGTIDAPAGNIYLDLFGGAIPVGTSNPGFDPAQKLYIGSHAQLLARGVVQSYGDPESGKVRNVVLDGGSVKINTYELENLYYPDPLQKQVVPTVPSPPAEYGLTPLGAVVAAAGALVDVSGVSGAIFLPQTGPGRGSARESIATNGGSLTIYASQGLLWNAAIDAHAGGAGASGGSFIIDQIGLPTATNLPIPYTQQVHQIVLSQHAADPAPGLGYADPISDTIRGKMFFSVDQIEAGGFDNVTLGGCTALTFDGNVNLHVADTLRINTQNLTATPDANVTLSASRVVLGNGQRRNVLPGDIMQIGSATAGTAHLTVNAELLDFQGTLTSGSTFSYTSFFRPVGTGSTPVNAAVALPGFAVMDFNSTGDIRSLSGELTTAISTQGDLNFRADQIYATTDSSFTISARGPTSTIRFARNDDILPELPLSEGALIRVVGKTIEQAGVLRAPMGQIVFGDSANPEFSTVTLLPGSVTSVSAEGALIPGDGSPAKVVEFYGSTVDVQSGALLNASGGGDLYVADFVPGRTGSRDVLDGPNTFAIVPSHGRKLAPHDPDLQRASSDNVADLTRVALNVGDEIFLSGIEGLAAGYYTLLPGHYALLPGGFRVTLAKGNLAPSQVTPNHELVSGSYLVSGHRANAFSGKRDRTESRFLVTKGDIVRKQAQYNETTVGKLLAAQAAAEGVAASALPADAARLLLHATKTLNFQGTGDFSIGAGGRGGQADIIGTNIFIAGSEADVAPTGYLRIDDATLNKIGAQSLLVGGKRTLGGGLNNANTLIVTPTAQFVELSGTATLAAPEVLLAATNSVVLDPGAVIDTTGFDALPDQFPTDPDTGLTLGKISVAGATGAFVMASNGTPLPVLRGATNAAAGTLVFGDGAAVFSDNNVVINSTRTTTLGDGARFIAPTIDVTADVINIGGGADGFTIDAAFLDTISQGDPTRGLDAPQTLILSASRALNTFGNAQLGAFDAANDAYSLQNLILRTPVIQGEGSAGDVARIAANKVTLLGAPNPLNAVAAGTGVLEFVTRQLVLGPGTLNVGGFESTTLGASGAISGNGKTVLNVSNDLHFVSPLITGANKADTTVNASGVVQFTRPSGAADDVNAAAAGLGAHLTVSGQSIEQNTELRFKSGGVKLIGDSVSVGNGAVIDVSGTEVPFFDVVRVTPGGSIILDAKNGDVSVAAGALLDLRGGDLARVDRGKVPHIDSRSSDEGSDAGMLSIAATGTAQLAGALKASAVEGYEGGRALLNLGAGDATTLLSSVANFAGEQSLTLATGDITIGSIKANKVNLSASTGNLTVTGHIDASGAKGGQINLNAGGNLTVASGAKLDARATSAESKGGEVMLGIDGLSTGILTLSSGSEIDVSGTKTGGRLWVRAPRVGTTGVAIASAGVTVRGEREVIVEAVEVTDVTANPFVDQALTAADAAAQAYMANEATIKASLGSLASASALHLQPGIELRSAGNLTLLQAPTLDHNGIDLHTYRYNGEPMVLTLRAAGNLNVNGSLSDGFGAPVAALPDPITGRTSGPVFALADQLSKGSRSSTLRLVAGANLGAADPLALVSIHSLASDSGAINLDARQLDQAGYPIASVLRTGTGDLALAAGRDINFRSQFGVYTAGTASDPVPDFTPPVRQMISNDRQPRRSFLGFFDPDGNPNTPDWAPGYDLFYPLALNASYPIEGGTLNVVTQGNLSSTTLMPPNGVPQFGGSQPNFFWLWTQYSGQNLFDQSTWFINFGTYYQAFHGGNVGGLAFVPAVGAPAVAAFLGLGALGGGAANVAVGGTMSNVDVAVPTTGRIPTGPASLDRAVIAGGGDLNVRVLGALNGGYLTVANGEGTVRAGNIGGTGFNMETRFSLGNDARLDAWSERDMQAVIAGMTSTARVDVDRKLRIGLQGFHRLNLDDLAADRTPVRPFGSFTTYTDDTAMSLRSIGDITLRQRDRVPAQMDVTAVTGSLISNSFADIVGPLFADPAPTSQIELLAGLHVGVGISTSGINPLNENAVTFVLPQTVGNFDGIGSPPDLVQPGDDGTNHVFALNGSITTGLATSKKTAIRAKLDIVAPTFYLQNNDEGDVSVIEAGRDIKTAAPPRTPLDADTFNIQIGGPGHLVVEAGRDVLIRGGLASDVPVGIASVGNKYNSRLPRQGASITMQVGVGAGPQNAAFIDAYLDPALAGDVAGPYAEGLVDYMQKRTGESLSIADAVAAFRALAPEQQTPYIQHVYFAEIKAGGMAAVKGEGGNGKGYERGYRVIDTLYPGSQEGAFKGDLTMFGVSRIRTESVGDININVPGGDIFLGREDEAPNLTNHRDTAKPGLLTLREGDINVMSEGDQIVAQSRVFTELGGDILMWSTNGDVNAGKGAQTSIVMSPPQITYDPNGNITKSPATPQTGAGIATLIGVPGVEPGDVFLFAPHGTVDAGDAGIRVSGNIYIGAQRVLNVDKIDVQGDSFGVPEQAGANVALTTTSAAATEASAIVKEMIAREPKTSVEVEVTGFGGDDASCADPAKRSSECPQE